MEGAVPKREGGALPRPLAWMEKFVLKRMQLKQFCVDEPKIVHQNKVGQIKAVSPEQGCILLTYLSVFSSKFIQKFAQKGQYFTLIDQSVPLYNFYISFYLRTKQLWCEEWYFHIRLFSYIFINLGIVVISFFKFFNKLIIIVGLHTVCTGL